MIDCRAMDRKSLAKYILIAALVFVLGWFGVDKLRDPYFWATYLPLWMDGLFGIPGDSWIIGIGFFEMLLAVLLLIPVRRVRQVATVLIVLHLASVVSQTGLDDIGIRDIGLLISAVALLLLL